MTEAFFHIASTLQWQVLHAAWGKAIVFPDVLIIGFFKFLQKIAINNSLSLFVNKNESANSTTLKFGIVLFVFGLNITFKGNAKGNLL